MNYRNGKLYPAGPTSSEIGDRDVHEMYSTPPIRLDRGNVSKIFDLRTSVLRNLSWEQRNLFHTRLLKKLTGERRGKLYLPDDFPSEVRALSKLTTGQLRHAVFEVTASHSANYVIDHRIVRYINQVYPGRCRTVRPNFATHCWQKAVVRPLRTEDWPRHGLGSAWPSSPTFNEMLEMSRAGKTPARMLRPRASPEPISVGEFNQNIKLASRLISDQIIGIRSDVKISRYYLDRFRYRDGFLILTTPYNLPAGLVRELSGQWIRNPHNLWLREKCSFRSYLKKTHRGSYP